MTTQVDNTRPREVKRKVVAILSADMKGYSRLMGEDEEWDCPYLEHIQGH